MSSVSLDKMPKITYNFCWFKKTEIQDFADLLSSKMIKDKNDNCCFCLFYA